MNIRFIKGNEDEHVISCTRNDGSVTWMQLSSFFVIHDLCHFAVETTLGFHTSFFGLLAVGTTISEFDLPSDKRTVAISEEAIISEQLVNLLVIESKQGKFENFKETMQEILRLHTSTNSEWSISALELETIRYSFAALISQWDTLAINETMELNFNM